jgi:arrestin-related trafficking adapter 4/5/7
MPFTHAPTSVSSSRDSPEDVSSYFTHIPQPPNLPRATHDAQDMGKAEKGHPALDIIVNSDVLILRGTGVDVAPALLSGNVVLYLSEPTSIKEISLSFRGKARIPPAQNESCVDPLSVAALFSDTPPD